MITIYGASDDLIEVEGDITEEFSPISDDDGYLLAFSDGTVLRIKYDDVWRITPVVRGQASLDIVQCNEDDDNEYTDKATLDGVRIDWVVLGESIARNIHVPAVAR